MKTLLDAARKAYPEFIWRGEEGVIMGAPRSHIEALGDSIRYMAPEQIAPFFKFKFSIDSGNCGMALQIALEREGWIFAFELEEFTGYKEIRKPIMVGNIEGYESHYIEHSADTKPELLLAIVRQGGGA